MKGKSWRLKKACVNIYGPEINYFILIKEFVKNKNMCKSV